MSEKRRILFVDDEANVLDGLRRALRPKRSEWDMVFALGAEAALAELRAAPCHVIVSDMRMPGMDGAQLLARVQAEFPRVVRIILSGQTEMEASLRASPVVHQFLNKPCDLDVLSAVVTRACDAVDGHLKSDPLQRVVGQITRLPSLPETYRRLTDALRDASVTLETITAIVESDVGICAKVLQLANSAFFGLPQQTSSTRAAIVVLGVARLRSLVLSAHLFDGVVADGVPMLSLAAMERHALCAAHIAAGIVTARHETDDAFAAALLHDVGLLVLASALPERCVELLARARQTQTPLAAVEIEPGIGHPDVGAHLLNLWGLPEAVVEAVRHHHRPAHASSKGFDLAGAVHVAVALAHDHGSPATELCEPCDTAYLASVGVEAQLPRWRLMAERVCGYGATG